METNSNSFTKFFLPSYFIIIGLVLIVISILVLIFAALVKQYLDFFPAAHQFLMFDRLILVCGLSLLVFSKENGESEVKDKARLNAFIFSLAASAILLIIIETLNTLNNNAPIYSVDFIIIEMCIYYIFFRIVS